MRSRNDKLFHKRRPTTAIKLKRKKPTLVPATRILIVTEGAVTEPEYFKHIRRIRSFPNLDIDICGKECGSSPTSVVNFAEEKANAEGSYKNGGYDSVFCVFDRDTHQDFERATSRIQTLNKPNSRLLAREIVSIRSFPCFEVWFIYHFEYTRAPFVKSSNCSAGENTVKKLQMFSQFNNYEKKLTERHLAILLERLDEALLNAKRADEDARQTGEKNPSTEVYLLIEAILASRNSTA